MGLSKNKRCESSANCAMQCDVAVVHSKGLSWGSFSSNTKDMLVYYLVRKRTVFNCF